MVDTKSVAFPQVNFHNIFMKDFSLYELIVYQQTLEHANCIYCREVRLPPQKKGVLSMTPNCIL